MKVIVRALPSKSTKALGWPLPCWNVLSRCQGFHTSLHPAANPLPSTTAGPPPSAPIPAASHHGERVDRRRKQAELLKRGQDLREGQKKAGSAWKKRFWNDVNIQTGSGTNHGLSSSTSQFPCIFSSMTGSQMELILSFSTNAPYETHRTGCPCSYLLLNPN